MFDFQRYVPPSARPPWCSYKYIHSTYVPIYTITRLRDGITIYSDEWVCETYIAIIASVRVYTVLLCQSSEDDFSILYTSIPLEAIFFFFFIKVATTASANPFSLKTSVMIETLLYRDYCSLQSVSASGFSANKISY